jgi:peptide/nickel transport system substrate-binding protein
MLQNDDIMPRKPSLWQSGGELVRFRKIDDTTVQFTFAVPLPAMQYSLSSRGGAAAQTFSGPFHPAHYLKQFHIDYNDKAGDLAKEAGFDEWYQLFGSKRQYSDDTYAQDLPVIDAWWVESVTLERVLMTRNPYYWKIDTAGNQLPYIDQVIGQVVEGNELVAAKAISGEQDVGAGIYGGSMTINKFPVFMQNANRNNYRVSLERTVTDPFATEVTILLNHTVEDPVLRELFNTPKFKHALSHAINRDEINDLVFQGVGTPRGAAIQAQAAYGALDYQENYIAYDPELAKRLLDEIGIPVGADGMRLRPDGTPLELIITIAGNRRASIPPTIELVIDHWGDVGIKASINDAGPRSGLWDQFRANESQISVWGIDESEYFLTEVGPQWWSGGWFWARLWHLWYATDGEEGEEPSPAAKAFIEAWRTIPVTADDAERQRIGHDALANLGENLWFMGVIAPGPDVRFARNNLKNIDLDRLPHLYYAFSGAFQWYLE